MRYPSLYLIVRCIVDVVRESIVELFLFVVQTVPRLNRQAHLIEISLYILFVVFPFQYYLCMVLIVSLC